MLLSVCVLVIISPAMLSNHIQIVLQESNSIKKSLNSFDIGIQIDEIPEHVIIDSLKIPNTEKDAKLDTGFKPHPGLGLLNQDDLGDQKPIYKTHPGNPFELILDLDAMLQYQKVLDSCNSTGIQPSMGYGYSNDTHIITNNSCEWQTIEEYENEN